MSGQWAVCWWCGADVACTRAGILEVHKRTFTQQRQRRCEGSRKVGAHLRITEDVVDVQETVKRLADDMAKALSEQRRGGM